jgi:hypothetical protein
MVTTGGINYNFSSAEQWEGNCGRIISAKLLPEKEFIYSEVSVCY